MTDRKETLKKYNNKPEVKERVRKWHIENKERVAEIKKEWKQRNPDADKSWYARNKERSKAINQKWVRRIRGEMIEAYGGKCSCCGEYRYEFLTLEHLKKDGAAHRKGRGLTSIIRELRLKGWPKEDYTILCWNCNTSKFMYGICPHQLE